MAIQLRDIGRIYNIHRGNGTNIDALRVSKVEMKILYGFSWEMEKLEFADDLPHSYPRDMRLYGRPEHSFYQVAKEWTLECSPLPIEDDRKGSTVGPLKLIKVDDIPIEEISQFYKEIIKIIIGEKDEKYGINRTNISRGGSGKPIRSIRGNSRSIKKKR